MKKEIFNKFYHYLNQVVNGTEFEGHVFLSGECVREFLQGKSEISKIDITVDIENGGIEFAKWLTQTEDCYVKDKNPVNIVSNQRAYFKITTNEDFKNIFVCCMQTRLNPSYSAVDGSSNFGSLIDDCVLKDISVHSMYLDVSCGEILDLANAVDDMKEMLIMTPNKPDIIYKDDPINMLKIIRYASQWQWDIEKRTWFGILKHHELIKKVSMERIKTELEKILLSTEPSYGLERLLTSGLLYDIFPQLYQLNQISVDDKTLFKHTLDVVDGVNPNLVTRLAALFHDLGKPFSMHKKKFVGYEVKSRNIAETIMKSLGYDAIMQEKVLKLIKYQNVFAHYSLDVLPKDNVLRKFAKLIGDDLDNAMDFIIADMGSDDNKKFIYANLIEENINRVINEDKDDEIELPVDGKTLMEEFNVRSGPMIGLLLAKIKESCKQNPNLTKEEALKIANEHLALIV